MHRSSPTPSTWKSFIRPAPIHEPTEQAGRSAWSALALAAAATIIFSLGVNSACGQSAPPAHSNYASPRVLQKSVVVAAPRAEVWSAWTTHDGLKSFLGAENRIELRPGGPYEIYFSMDAPPGSRGAEGCTVLSFLPEQMLSFTWNAPPSIPRLRDAQARTQVVIELAQFGPDKTSLRLTQHGFGEGEDWDAYYKYFDRAWGVVLEQLRARFSKNAADGAPKQWVYFVRPVREGFFEQATPEENAVVKEHAAYVAKLTADGTVLFAGPCLDPCWFPTGEKSVHYSGPTPGIVAFEATDEIAAQKIMNDDPAIAAGVFSGKLTIFHLAFQRGRH